MKIHIYSFLFWSLAATLFVCVQPASGQSADKLDSLFKDQLSAWPQDKIYLHTDKSTYIAGEELWFRAHLVDAATHLSSDSRYVYVELIDPTGKLVSRAKIRPEHGVFKGNFTLSAEMSGGNYLLRCYTRLMEAMGEEYFFKKTVLIGAPFSARYRVETSLGQTDSRGGREIMFDFRDLTGGTSFTPDVITLIEAGTNEKRRLRPDRNGRLGATLAGDVRSVTLEYEYEGRHNAEIVPVQNPSGDFDVSFLPEGGRMICGRSSRVAFKAINSGGMGEDVSVVIVSDRGDTLGNFHSRHKGMGRFVMIPRQGESYYALCRALSGSVKRFDLPKAALSGVSLNVDWRDDKLYIRPIADHSFDGRLNVVIQSRGVLVDVASWENNDGVLTIASDRMPQGVVQILLTDADMHPLCERLIFNIDPARIVTTTIATGKTSYGKRELIEAALQVAPPDGKPLAGSFSVSVTDDGYVETGGETDIFSTLLLSSEIRGHIESPAWYFRDIDDEKLVCLDILMMTQGWSRYDIEAVFGGRSEHLPGYMELGPVISGSVKGGLFGSRTGKGYPVTLASSDAIMFSETDDYGHFSFDLPETPEGTPFLVYAGSPRGGKYVELYIDEEEYPKPRFSLPQPFAAKYGAGRDRYMQRAEQKYELEHGTRLIMLDDITVRASRIRPPERHASYPDIYLSGKSYADSTLMVYGSVRSFLEMNGFTPGRNRILVDGTEEMPERHTDLLSALQIDNVAEVILLQGAEAYFYGGGMGLANNNASPEMGLSSSGIYTARTALISTKTGYGVKGREEYDLNRAIVEPPGYTVTKEFYSPQYETFAKRNSSTPDLRTTLYWDPDVMTDASGRAELDFYSADTTGPYTVIIEGVTLDGRPVYSEQSIGR